MKESENQLSRIVDTIPTLAWSARSDGSVEFVNQCGLDYSGLYAKEVASVPAVKTATRFKLCPVCSICRQESPQ